MKDFFHSLLLSLIAGAALVGPAAAAAPDGGNSAVVTSPDVLRGEWFGKVRRPERAEMTIVLRFSTGTDGALQGVMDVPENFVKDMEVRDISLDDGQFSAAIPKPHVKITGKLEGDQIVAQWSQNGGTSLPLTLTKGRYVAVPIYLDLPTAARDQLRGRWSGRLKDLAVIVRFETDAQGRTLGFFDITQKKLLNIPMKEAELAGTKLTFDLSIGAKYTAELAGGKLTGEWTQPGSRNPVPLVLTREK